MNSLFSKKLFFLIIFYIFSTITLYFSFLFSKIILDKFLLSLFISIFIVGLISLFIIIYAREVKFGGLQAQGAVRYIMLCHSCNWEWMSNKLSEHKPTKCPNCANLSRLEVIGWRRLQNVPKKSNKNLENFFKIKK
jgi:hypothetical protein